MSDLVSIRNDIIYSAYKQYSKPLKHPGKIRSKDGIVYWIPPKIDRPEDLPTNLERPFEILSSVFLDLHNYAFAVNYNQAFSKLLGYELRPPKYPSDVASALSWLDSEYGDQVLGGPKRKLGKGGKSALMLLGTATILDLMAYNYFLKMHVDYDRLGFIFLGVGTYFAYKGLKSLFKKPIIEEYTPPYASLGQELLQDIYYILDNY